MQFSKDEPRRKAVELVAGELEAAEALAGLAHGGVASSWPSDQGQATASQRFCGYMNERTVETRPSEQLCSTSYKSNFVTKLRPKLTEAEKEARKLRRILTNRESARQTIRRRQAIYMDLTKRAADLSEENENLKRDKELVVEEYNSLKGRNEFLKAQMAKLKNAEAGDGPHISCSETSNTPNFPHNQSSLVPCVWPSILPYTDLRQLQYLSRSNVPNSSQFSRPEIPFVVVPVPWLLNFLPPPSDTNDTRNIHQSSTDTLLHGDNVQLSSNRNMRVEASNSTTEMAMDMDSVYGAGLTLSRGSGDQYTGYNPRGHETTRHCPLQKSKEAFIRPTRNREDVLAAVEARRRRKELMRLKSTNDQS